MGPFHMRPTRREDATAAIDVINAYATALNGGAEDTVESLLVDWSTPGLCLDTDCVVVEQPDGRLAAAAEMWDLQDSHLRMYGYWRVHPDFENLGIEERLAAWIEERARRGVPLALAGGRVALIHRFSDKDKEAQRVLMERGYRVIRQLVRMETNLEGDGGNEAAAPGIRLLPLDEGLKDGAVRALYEAFRDHWGSLPETYEQYRGRILHLFERPSVSPALSLAALDGDEVIAATISSKGMAGDPLQGWIHLLGVRRAWRKRGVGEALLRRSFASFRAAGLASAGLNVDAESLTGATRLYERVGMRVTRRYLTYELELRPGEEMIVT